MAAEAQRRADLALDKRIGPFLSHLFLILSLLLLLHTQRPTHPSHTHPPTDLCLDHCTAAAKKSGAYRVLSKFDSLMHDQKFLVKVGGMSCCALTLTLTLTVTLTVTLTLSLSLTLTVTLTLILTLTLGPVRKIWLRCFGRWCPQPHGAEDRN